MQIIAGLLLAYDTITLRWAGIEGAEGTREIEPSRPATIPNDTNTATDGQP